MRASKTLYGPKIEEEKKRFTIEHVRIHEIPATKVLDSGRLFKILKNPEAVSEIDTLF